MNKLNDVINEISGERTFYYSKKGHKTNEYDLVSLEGVCIENKGISIKKTMGYLHFNSMLILSLQEYLYFHRIVGCNYQFNSLIIN